MLTEFDVLKIRKNVIGKVCNNQCDGTGVVVVRKEHTIEFVDCACVKEFKKHIALVRANIPPKHWDFSLRNLTAAFMGDNREEIELIKNYCSNIANAVDAGAGLFIQGSSGLAKSALAYYILKSAISADLVGYSVRMSALTTMLLESFKDQETKELLDWIRRDVQILVLDEIDKDYKINRTDTYTGTHVNEYLSYLYDKKVALLITSNTPLLRAELEKIHAPNIVDRFMELTPVTLTGESYRGKNNLIQQILNR